MTKTDASWPEIRIVPSPEDSDFDEIVDEWMQDSFRRKVLHLFHSMTETGHIVITSFLSIVILIVANSLDIVSYTASNLPFALLLASATLVTVIDRILSIYYRSIIHMISFQFSYWVLLLGSYLYAYAKEKTVSRSRISHVLSSHIVNYIPAIRLKNKIERAFRPKY